MFDKSSEVGEESKRHAVKLTQQIRNYEERNAVGVNRVVRQQLA